MTTQHLRVASPPADRQVAIYARVSSDQQAERHTIDSQIAELKARALRDGYQVREDMLFIDNGHSGASLIRPALERLRDLIAFSAVDIVYVHAPDRLARSYAHQVLLLEEFSRAGTQVVFLNRPIGDTPEDSLLLQLQGMFAEYKRAKMLERSRRGKRHRAQAGAVSVLARAPFGYRYITREAGGGAARYEIDEDAARIVRQIFTWVGHERLTLTAVCRRLLVKASPALPGSGTGAVPQSTQCCSIRPMRVRPSMVAASACRGNRLCIRLAATPACQSGPTDKFPHRLSDTSAWQCRLSSTRNSSRAPQSGCRRTENAIASGWPAFNTCCAVCSYVRRADMGLPVTTIRGGGATIDAVAPIAAASTVSSVVMRGWLQSSRSMMPCGPRFVGCWKTPRS